MQLLRDGTFERNDMWREGKWLDLWSVVHLLSGASIGFSLHLMGFGGAAAAAIAFLLMLAYELWEAAAKIEEAFSNHVADIGVGLASFAPTFFFLAPALSPAPLALVFASVLAADILMSFFGWRASQKAAALEAAMRREYELQRSRMRERFARRRKRKAKRDPGRAFDEDAKGLG